MIDDKTMERLIGLINKSKSGGGVTEGEASNATTLARRIIAEHKVQKYAVVSYGSRGGPKVLSATALDDVYVGVAISTAFQQDSDGTHTRSPGFGQRIVDEILWDLKFHVTSTDNKRTTSAPFSVKFTGVDWESREGSFSNGASYTVNPFSSSGPRKTDFDWSESHREADNLDDEEFFEAYAKQVGRIKKEVLAAVIEWAVSRNMATSVSSHALFRLVMEYAEATRGPKILVTYKGMSRDIRSLSDTDLVAYKDEMESGRDSLIQACQDRAIKLIEQKNWSQAKAEITSAESIQRRPIGNTDYTKIVAEIDRRNKRDV